MAALQTIRHPEGIAVQEINKISGELRMLEYFLPKEMIYFNFFESHAAIVVKAGREFLDKVSQPTLDLSQSSNTIKELEIKADVIVHECLEALHKTFITPIDRDCIYSLMSSMDNVVDAINLANNCLIIYKLKNTTPELRRLAQIVLLSTQKIEEIVSGLRHTSNADRISAVGIEIHRLENEADDVLHAAIARLFDEEEDVRNIIKWKDVYEALERSTDYCEDVADTVQSIILETL